jgi:hypothetical protein
MLLSFKIFLVINHWDFLFWGHVFGFNLMYSFGYSILHVQAKLNIAKVEVQFITTGLVV